MNYAVVRHGLAAAAVLVCLCLTGQAALSADPVCQTEDCWHMSNLLHVWLNTSASPCDDFEGFLCDGFRSSHQFTGKGLLSGGAFMDYMQQIGTAYSERVTEQLATGCWDADCSDTHRPASPKLLAYERLAFKTLRECVYMESVRNQSLHDLVKLNLREVLEEAINLGTEGIAPTSQQNLRFESLLPAQSAKSLHSPLTAVAKVATRHGRPAVLLVAEEPFLGLPFVFNVLSLFPMQMSRLLRQLRMPLPRGLAGLVRYAQVSLQLWDVTCSSTATKVAKANSHQPVRTVKDAKQLLRAANLTFDLDEFLRLSLAQWKLTMNDTTDLMLSDPTAFLNTVCLLEQCARRRPDLAKVLVMHQVTRLAVEVLDTPEDASCIDEFFGNGGGGKGADGRDGPYVGTFRPLLHGRYARILASPIVEAEARDLFAQLKTTYIAAVEAKKWVPTGMKHALSQRLSTIKLEFQRNSLSEENLLHHYRGVMDSMHARSCSWFVHPACLLVRTRALKMSLGMRVTHATLDNQSPHYAQLQDTVYLTPAFSDPPHYRTGQPMAVRLGLLGFVFAHELTHGLVVEPDSADQLKLVLEDSNQLPSSWTEDFARRFRARETCLRDRMTTRQDLNKTSVTEDVADLIGLSVAFRMLNQSGDTQRLPGYMSRFSPAQLFYIASMRTFCSKSVPNFWRKFLSVSAGVSHTPGKMRIQSMISGDANFAQVFGCPTTTARNATGDGTSHSAEERMCEFW